MVVVVKKKHAEKVNFFKTVFIKTTTDNKQQAAKNKRSF